VAAVSAVSPFSYRSCGHNLIVSKMQKIVGLAQFAWIEAKVSDAARNDNLM